MPVYICEHDIPAETVVTSDPTNLLIRALKPDKGDQTKSMAEINSDSRGKRSAESAPEGAVPSKKYAIGSSSFVGAQGARQETRAYTESDFAKMTVEQLKNVLKEKRLPTKGKKDELIKKILQYQQRTQKAAQPSNAL
ncbi:hypothetical protein CYMTET_25361 [Cymbomonas tetramitiformis]|uniref:SAP domain-containing protein n=1 Tax=Cymbomonas tetramitiformis TaxID=36881 RepID=A0AAE0FUK7_9CHLO|nr:hypothetical protein CYMTET_25361 [Cymbomonas tetramitiformis]